ncbi:MAG TPA: universal stress protein [Woeseiaceae bacterium]|nr:universal stress protein [Woeseiaceae bacterium]
MAEIKSILADVNPDRRIERGAGLLAIDRARQLAIASGASVDLFVCDSAGSLADGVLFDNESVARARIEYMQELQNWLESQAAPLREEGGQVTCHVEWHSPRYEAILEKAREVGADLIVRSARRHGRIDRLFFGATDWELIRRAPQLLWLCKKVLDPLSSGLRIIAAVDPSHPEEKKAGLDRKLVEVAGDLVNLFGGSLHLFHAYRPGAMVAPVASATNQGAVPVMRLSSELAGELEKHRRTELRRLAESAGISSDHVHLVSGNTSEALEELVMQLEIDVVVAGAVSRGRVERLLIGSTAEAILDDVHCDVVVVKPDHFPAEER